MRATKQLKQALELAVKAINGGGIVICPTDTIYGFLADAGNKKAVEKIFKIKKRPKSKPLAVFVKDFKMASELAEISAEQKKTAKKHWPGKYTFILKSKGKNNLSKLVLGKNDTIAIRIPKYKFLNNLLKEINKPLAQTSVNLSGEPPLTKISDILKFLKNCGTSGFPQFVIDGGNLKKGKPSKIIDLTTKLLTRIR